MKRQIFPTASKYRRRTRREFGGETVEYIIVILAVVVIGGGLMGFGNQVSGQIGKTGNSISSWFGKANGAGDNASGGNGTGEGNNAGVPIASRIRHAIGTPANSNSRSMAN